MRVMAKTNPNRGAAGSAVFVGVSCHIPRHSDRNNDGHPPLSGVMRSIGDEQWRRHRREHDLPTPGDGGGVDDPERACAAAEALVAIQRLFASDAAALKVITGLISGVRQCRVFAARHGR